MKLSLLKLFIGLLFLNFYSNSFSQDFHLSQYWASPLNLNSALSGHFDKNIRISATYRNQWINFNSFSVYNISVDANILKKKLNGNYLGVGVNIFQEKEAINNFTNSGFNFSLAFNKRIGARGLSHNIALGVSSLYTIKQTNFKELVYGNLYEKNDNYDPIDLNDSKMNSFFDLGFGVNYSLRIAKKHGANLSFSVFNILEQQKDYGLYKNVLIYRRYSFNASSTISLNSKFNIIPLVLVQSQGTHFEFNFGSYFKYLMNKRKNTAFYFGVQYRMVAKVNNTLGSDALILGLRTEIKNFDIGFTYDITLSDLQKLNQFVGGPELSLSYSFLIKKNNNFMECPKF